MRSDIGKALVVFLCTLCIVQMIALDSSRSIIASLEWRCRLLTRHVNVRPQLIPNWRPEITEQ